MRRACGGRIVVREGRSAMLRVAETNRRARTEPHGVCAAPRWARRPPASLHRRCVGTFLGAWKLTARMRTRATGWRPSARRADMACSDQMRLGGRGCYPPASTWPTRRTPSLIALRRGPQTPGRDPPGWGCPGGTDRGPPHPHPHPRPSPRRRQATLRTAQRTAPRPTPRRRGRRGSSPRPRPLATSPMARKRPSTAAVRAGSGLIIPSGKHDVAAGPLGYGGDGGLSGS